MIKPKKGDQIVFNQFEATVVEGWHDGFEIEFGGKRSFIRGVPCTVVSTTFVKGEVVTSESTQPPIGTILRHARTGMVAIRNYYGDWDIAGGSSNVSWKTFIAAWDRAKILHAEKLD